MTTTRDPSVVVTVPLVAAQSCAYHMATERGFSSQTGSQPTQVLQAISNRNHAGSNKDSHRKSSGKKDICGEKTGYTYSV